MVKHMRGFLIAVLAAVLFITTAFGASAVAAENSYKIAYVANTAINDGGWNSSCYGAMVNAAAEYGFETAYTEKVAQTDYVSVFTNYCNMGYNAIFAPGNEFTDAVKEVASYNPDTTFILLNGSVATDNIISICADNYQLGQIAGVVAALQTQTNSVALVGGIQIDPALQSLEGFEYALNKINPEITNTVLWTGTFDDASKGKEAADSLVTTANVDVIYGLASIVDSGIREAISEYENVWNIAQPGDMATTDPEIILTSVCSSTEYMLGIALDMITKGEANAIINGDLSNGCVFIGGFGSCASDNLKDNLQGYLDEILAGTF